ncbi:MAG: flagellar motor protein [Bdellovibrionales bacterium]
MDITTILGFVIGIGGILLGQVLEGGHVSSIMQFTAAIIVVGGTAGAVLVGSPMEDIKTAMKLLKLVFFNPAGSSKEKIIADILDAAQTARKESILALEKKLGGFNNEYMQTIFRFVIDGIDSKTLEDVFETEIYLEEESNNAGAKVFMDAGGFSPTIGIIGAVLGLIHVMENLSDTSKLGSGIAVAFVATVYGVGLANLMLIPMANKLKRKIKLQSELKEMILIGALGIVGGQNPFIIEQKLRAYTHGSRKKEGV